MSTSVLAYDTQDGNGTITLLDPTGLTVLGSAVDTANGAVGYPLVLAIDPVNERLWSLGPAGVDVFDISVPATPVLLTTGGPIVPTDSLSVPVFPFSMVLAPDAGRAYLQLNNSSTSDAELAVVSLTALTQTAALSFDSIVTGIVFFPFALDENGSSPRLWLAGSTTIILNCLTNAVITSFAFTSPISGGPITPYINQTTRKAYLPYSDGSSGGEPQIAVYNADTYASLGTISGLGAALPVKFNLSFAGLYSSDWTFSNTSITADEDNGLLFVSASDRAGPSLFIAVIDMTSASLSTTYTSTDAAIVSDKMVNPSFSSDIQFFDGLLYIYGNAPHIVAGILATMTESGTFTYYAGFPNTTVYRLPVSPGIVLATLGAAPTTTTAAPITPEITAASPVNWRTVQFQLASAPQFAKTPYALGDALNPSSWTLERADGSQTFTAIQVIDLRKQWKGGAIWTVVQTGDALFLWLDHCILQQASTGLMTSARSLFGMN